MANNNPLDYEKMSHETRDRHVNFLLAAAGACIAFAVTQTRGQQLTWFHLPLGLALIAWAGSFFWGCSFLRLRANGLALKAAAQLAKPGPENLNERAAATHMRRTIRPYFFQFWFLIAGAALFLIWHVLDMWNTPAKPFWA